MSGWKVAVCALALALLAGCNTMSGMGKDIKAGGQAIEDAANSTTKKKPQQ
ncbi:MAG TPA: entericidin A/B family lipoprotein [Burkholderiaceae bacterium]|nr:entericidin A/B family lipoprotein [Burkholderiaceae bacterium]